MLSEPPPPVTESRYRVKGELGRGGMGSVELVEDTHSGATLALKRLLLDKYPDGQRERVLRLFEQEYHVLSQLDHPRIIRVFDYGRDALGPYYTMEVVEGQDVRGLTPMPYRDACAVGRDVASSLAILHGRGFVHRDVTPQNIRCSPDGQAKLLDFGAMCPMGVPKGVVGTPPFVAPESIQRNALDGRTDLFALGASLYYALTGQHAYPARTLHQLHNVWRSPLKPPSALNAEVPERLDELVLELLSLSPLARPQSAAVVFERLVAIGELPRVEQLEVRSAYLTSPTLVGRDASLGGCREQLLQAIRGRGSAALVSAAAGLGRSRMLDTLVLEGKILGALVLRADASDAAHDFGALRSLVQQLEEARPGTVLAYDALQRLLEGGPIGFSGRRRTLEAFSAALLDHGRGHRLLIAVDDVHLLDEPSLAGIAGLASELLGSRTLLVCSADEDAAPRSRAAMELLTQSARTHGLSPLSEPDMRRMLGSVFGAAPNLDVLAAVLSRHSEGNPAQIMAAAQALVDAQVVRYEAGAWVLPTRAVAIEAAIPTTTEGMERLCELSPDARALAAIIALDVHRKLQVVDWARVSDHGDLARIYRALDTLVAAGVVTRHERGGDLRRQHLAGQIGEALPEAQRNALHSRLAAVYAGRDDAPAQAYHLVRAGAFGDAEALVLNGDARDIAYRWGQDVWALETFDAVIAARSAADPDAPVLVSLRARLLTLCLITEEWPRVARAAPTLVEDLAWRCGLRDYAALDDVPEAERLGEAVARAERRHAEALERAGLDESAGLPLLAALQQLPVAVLGAASAAVLAADPDIACALPSLEPLHPLSPAFPFVDRLRAAITLLAIGDVTTSLCQVREIHQELLGDAMGLDQSIRDSLLTFSQGFVQGIDATIGNPAVLERVEESKRHNAKRAERERYSYYVAIGDTEMARRTRRDLERLEVQSGAAKHFPHCWEVEYSLHSLTRNVEGLKRCEEEARQVAEELPGWRKRVELARVALAQCGAASDETIARARSLFEGMRRGTADRRYALYLLALGLIDLERYQEASELLRTEMESLGRPPQWHDGYGMMLGLAEAHLGNHEEAEKHVAEHLRAYEEAGVRGLLAGNVQEVMAQIALMAGDEERFRFHAERCAEHYRSGHNPDLTTRYEILMRRARELNVHVSGELAQAAEFTPRTSASVLVSLLRTEVSTVLDAPTRHRQLLSLVAERSGARGGLLYIPDEEGTLRKVAAIGEHPAADELDERVQRFWHAEHADEETRTATVEEAWELATRGGDDDGGPGDGTGFYTLIPSSSPVARSCGVLVLSTRADAIHRPDREAIAALARLLLEETPGGAREL